MICKGIMVTVIVCKRSPNTNLIFIEPDRIRLAITQVAKCVRYETTLVHITQSHRTCCDASYICSKLKAHKAPK